MELKFLPRWPKVRDDDPVLISHFTPQQRIWLRQWYRAGGRAWVLFQVGQEFLLFKGEVAAEALGKVSQKDLRNLCYRVWDRLDERELRECVS